MNKKSQQVTKSISSSIENNQECGRDKTQWKLRKSQKKKKKKKKKKPFQRKKPNYGDVCSGRGVNQVKLLNMLVPSLYMVYGTADDWYQTHPMKKVKEIMGYIHTKI